MRVLLVHHEAEYFAGAERVLGYFLEGLCETDWKVTVAAVQDSRVREVIPAKANTCWVPRNSRFSVLNLLRQLGAVMSQSRTERFDVVHGWAARDWELTALAGWRMRRPAIGTLHDHPRASFISPMRQRLMSWSAARGLAQVVCVSDAVRRACVAVKYDPARLAVVHNGLPPCSAPERRPNERFRLGFLGLFSERKGLRGLFEMVDELSKRSAIPWELALAGDAQEEEGRRLVGDLKAKYSTRSWWQQVRWHGWVKRPGEFLSSLDLLICPSSEFDPFPTVLLEAGRAGLPVLAARVGGVPEIVENQVTGWLFDQAAWDDAAARLQGILEQPSLARAAGVQAKKRVERDFAIRRMVQDYLNVYMDLSRI